MLDWLSILIENRTFRADGDIAHDAISYIKSNFSVDYKNRDVIRGWRADDSYFSFALGFVSGTLSYRQLCHAMRLGNLGEQIVIKSEKAFHELEFVDAEEASRKIWLESKTRRDSEARAEFKASRKMRRQRGDIYITDIMDEEMKRNDPRLQ